MNPKTIFVSLIGWLYLTLIENNIEKMNRIIFNLSTPGIAIAEDGHVDVWKVSSYEYEAFSSLNGKKV